MISWCGPSQQFTFYQNSLVIANAEKNAYMIVVLVRQFRAEEINEAIFKLPQYVKGIGW